MNKKFAELYHQLYQATEEEALSPREEAMVGLAAALALDCEPCTRYYKERCSSTDVSDKDINHVLEKVMIVSAGQKKLMMKNM